MYINGFIKNKLDVGSREYTKGVLRTDAAIGAVCSLVHCASRRRPDNNGWDRLHDQLTPVPSKYFVVTS